MSALALALVSAPGVPDAALTGAPLALPGYGAVAVVAGLAAVLAFFPPRAWEAGRTSALLAVLVAAKVALGVHATPEGWSAAYRFSDTKGESHRVRFFHRFRSHDERWEDHAGLWSGRADLHFFNDVMLFGYPPYDPTPREIRFPLEVTWTGYVEPADAPLTWTATAAGDITVTTDDGTRTLRDPDNHNERFTPKPGGGRVIVTYRKAAGTPPDAKFAVRNASAAGLVPVSRAPGPPSTARRVATTAVVMLGLAWLVVAVGAGMMRHGIAAPMHEWPVRTAALVTTLALIGWACVLALRWHGLTAFLAPGGDPLFYGSSARDILHNGVLMLHGAPRGQAAPFYFYPLYPYLLAAGHALFGETAAAIYLVNGLLQACLPALFFLLGWRALSPASSAAAFGALGLFLYACQGVVFAFEQPSFTDVAYMTAVFTALAALAAAFERLSVPRLVLAGFFLALGAATRPSMMTLVWLAPFALAWRIRPFARGRWMAAAGWLACGVALGLAPFTLRNAIAAGKLVVLVNSWIQIPYFLIPPEVAEKPGGMPGLIEAIGMAWDIFKEHPTRTLVVEGRKVLYTLGFTAVGPREMLQAPTLALLPPLFLWALVRRRIPYPASLVVVTFAISHSLAMFIAAPWTFHFKSILPLHAALLFGAGFLLPAAGVHHQAGETAASREPGRATV